MGRLLLERFRAQLLTERRRRAPADVAGHLLAVQAQDLRAAGLAVRARSLGVSQADVHRCLSEERSLAVGWLNRGTLHLVAAEDYWWLHALTAARTTTSTMRRLAEEGIPPQDVERALGVLTRALASDGPLRRRQVAEVLASAGVPSGGQAVVHLLALASSRCAVMRGPVLDGSQAFVLAAQWLPPPPTVDHDVALARLAGRYLAAHSPATVADLARWSGLPLTDARRGLAALPDLRDVGEGLVALPARRHSRSPDVPAPRLLGPFDPLLLGWRSRDEVLGTYGARIVSGGVLRAVTLVGGRATGTWQLTRGRVHLSPFEVPTDDDAAALEKDARDVERFLGARRSQGDPRAPDALVGD